MRTVQLLFLIPFFVAGCKNKNSLPGGILPQKKMQAIVWDIMRADQFLADYVINKDTSLDKTTESLKYYQRIFAIHDVTKEEFQHSFSYYQDHPALFKAIMDSINAPEKVAPTTPVQPEPLTDSITTQPDTTITISPKAIPDTPTTKKKVKRLAE